MVIADLRQSLFYLCQIPPRDQLIYRALEYRVFTADRLILLLDSIFIAAFQDLFLSQCLIISSVAVVLGQQHNRPFIVPLSFIYIVRTNCHFTVCH